MSNSQFSSYTRIFIALLSLSLLLSACGSDKSASPSQDKQTSTPEGNPGDGNGPTGGSDNPAPRQPVTSGPDTIFNYNFKGKTYRGVFSEKSGLSFMKPLPEFQFNIETHFFSATMSLLPRPYRGTCQSELEQARDPRSRNMVKTRMEIAASLVGLQFDLKEFAQAVMTGYKAASGKEIYYLPPPVFAKTQADSFSTVLELKDYFDRGLFGGEGLQLSLGQLCDVLNGGIKFTAQLEAAGGLTPVELKFGNFDNNPNP